MTEYLMGMVPLLPIKNRIDVSTLEDSFVESDTE